MGLLRSLAMQSVILLWFLWPVKIGGQNISVNLDPARTLDMLLQDYAYGAFNRPRTGIPYDGNVTSNLTGIKIAAMRLRSGSLRRRGAIYKEFVIPKGVIETPYVERLVLVYQNLGNWSTEYYRLPGYSYIAPVLGLRAYNASNLSATNLSELHLAASGSPILIRFTNVTSPPMSVPRCVWFSLQGFANFSALEPDNTCSTREQGHFAIVVESVSGKKSSKAWIIVVSVLGGLALLVSLILLCLCARKHKQRKKIARMERAADAGEALHMTSVGDSRAPVATVTRTQPLLEHEYVP